MSRRAHTGRAALAGVAALLALTLVASAHAKREPSREELVNFLLGPEYSHWMAGAVGRIASPGERAGYLALSDDAAAAEFIEAFWKSRKNPESPWPADQPRAIYERRAEEADRLYSEGTRLGRLTDRGVVFVLHGEPARTEFRAPSRGPRRGTEEIWYYPKDAPPGLDGESPKRSYVFVERRGVTVER